MTNLGGGNVGGARIELQAEVVGLEKAGGQFQKLAQQIKATFEGLSRGELFSESVIVDQIKAVDKALRDLRTAIGKELIPSTATKGLEESLARIRAALQAQLGTLRTTSQIAPTVDQATKSLQGYGKQQAAAAVADAKRTQELQKQAQLQAVGVQQVDATTRAIQNYGKAQVAAAAADAKRAAELQKQASLQAAGVPVVNQTTKAVQAYGLVQARAIQENERLSKSTTGIRGVFARLNDTLGDVGLNISGISVLLGAGFAGGAAGVIKIAIDLASAFGKAVDEITRIERETDRVFDAAAGDVREFAEVVAEATGRTRSEVLNAINAFAQFGRVSGVTRGDLQDFSTELGRLAAQLEKTIPSVHNIEEATSLLIRALKGDKEALAELNFTLQELRAVVQELFPGRSLDQLTEAEKRFLGLQLAARANARALDETGEKASTFFDNVKQFTNDILRLSREIDALFGVGVPKSLNTARKELNHLLDDAGGLQGFFEGLFFLRGPREADLSNFAKTVRQLGTEQIESLRNEAKGHKDVIEVIDEELRRRKELREEGDKGVATAEDLARVARENEEAFRNNTAAVRQAVDAVKALARAEEDAAIRIAEANRELQRAREDAALEETELRRDSRRELEDANRDISEANEEIRRAQEDRLRDIEKVEFEFAREMADIRQEHQRETQDLNREHNRKLEDFAEEEVRIEKERARGILEALIAIQDAQFNFTTSRFNEAQRRLSDALAKGREAESDLEKDRTRELEDFRLDKLREREDFEEAAAEAREDRIRELHDIEIDSTRELVDANRELQEALIDRQRALEDFIVELHRLEIENNRALFDAQKQVEAAEREAQRALDDARLALNRLIQDYSITLDVLERVVNAHLKWKKTLEEIAAGQTQIQDVPFSPGFIVSGPGRQHGGPFAAGRPFFGVPAGERGPMELIVPGTGGTVVSNAQVLRAIYEFFSGGKRTNGLFGGGGIGGASPTIQVFEAVDAETTAFTVLARLGLSLNN